jgi:hypothetical protein
MLETQERGSYRGMAKSCRPFYAGICLWLAFLLSGQDAKAGGSPLDTLLSTRLFADVPEAKDFVRETRPPPETLDYVPLTGPDREGEKPKSKDELKALASELEAAAAHNEQLARDRLGYTKPAAPAKPRESQPNSAAKR